MTRKHKKKTFTGVLYLNRYFLPFHSVTKMHAIKAVVSGRAVAINPKTLKAIDGASKNPSVLQNIKLVLFDRDIQTGPKRLRSRTLFEGVLERDDYICIYCGDTADTVDHVIPKAQKGTTTSKNCVAACKKCNMKKADRTPEEAGMPFLYQPKTVAEILADRFKQVLESEADLDNS